MSEFIERYWRDATPQDAIKEPPMVARFRDEHYRDWVIDKLIFWDRSETPWHRDDGYCYERCQVYEAPDPGEGWRLVDPNTEILQEGDGLMVSSHRESGWVEIQVRPNSWSERDFYRRRIEQSKPEPRYEPFRWEDRDQLRGRWIVDRTGEQEYTIDDFLNDDDVLYICGHPAEYFLNWRFLDTGEPVGRRVES